MRLITAFLAAFALLLLPLGASAAPGDWVFGVQPMAVPADGAGLPLQAPPPQRGAPHEAWAINGDARMVYNITRPELIPVEGAATPGAKPAPAIILVPGGGFEFLAIDNEGFRVAARLAPLGVKVFILKYRTVALPDNFPGFQDAIANTFANRPRAAGPVDILADVPNAVADAQTAMRYVRAHAAQWGVDPQRIGMVGFSAGAVTTLNMAQANAADARPDFVGLIYGPTRTGVVPPNAPPLFAAIAANDRFFGHDNLGLIEAWRDSGASVEFHLYSGGGHGFASAPNGTTSDDWFNGFARWLAAEKFVDAP